MDQPDTQRIARTVWRQRAKGSAHQRTYELLDFALAWQDEGKPRDGVLYDRISSVHLICKTSIFSQRSCRARIQLTDGGAVEIVCPAGVNDATDCGQLYATFITELHNRLIERGGTIHFRRGAGIATYVALCTALALGAMVIAQASIILATADAFWLAAALVALALCMVPTLWRTLHASWPGAYDPRAIPSPLLPKA